MLTINVTLKKAMRDGKGIPVLKLHYTDENDDSQIVPIIEYEFDRLQAEVKVKKNNIPTIPKNGMFYIERGVFIKGKERTVNTYNFFLTSQKENTRTIIYKGHIFPNKKAEVSNANETAQSVIAAALLDAGVTANFPSGGDEWYSWTFDNENTSLILANLQTIISIVKKKYIAGIFPRKDGIEFGHPGSYDNDEFSNYVPEKIIKQAPLQSQSIQLKATDESGATRIIGANNLPIHNIGFLHTDTPDSSAEKISYILNGEDTYEQRPDFRIEQGDKITPPINQSYSGITCLEYTEIYRKTRGKLSWRQIIKQINLNIKTSADKKPDASGNPDSTVDSAIRIIGDKATFRQRMIGTSRDVDHFDKDLSKWSWSGTPPLYSLSIYPSLLYIIGSGYLYKAIDTTKNQFFAQVSILTSTESSSAYIAIRIDDGSDNNYVEAKIKGIGKYKTYNIQECTGGNVTYYSNPNGIPSPPHAANNLVLSVKAMGTLWSLWKLRFYVSRQWSGPSPYQEHAMYYQTGPDNLTWTPARVGIVTYGSGIRFAIDAAGYLNTDMPSLT